MQVQKLIPSTSKVSTTITNELQVKLLQAFCFPQVKF